MSHSGQVGHEDMQLVTSENSGLHDTDGKREGRNEIPLNHIQRSSTRKSSLLLFMSFIVTNSLLIIRPDSLSEYAFYVLNARGFLWKLSYH